MEVAPGKYFTIHAPMASKDNKYIQEAKLNGMILDRSFITHVEIMSGGTLEFAIGAVPKRDLFK